MKWLSRCGKGHVPSQDDKQSHTAMLDICRRELTEAIMSMVSNEVPVIRAKAEKQTAWRIEGTLREFPRFDPINLWFDFPIHTIDPKGTLKDVKPDSGYTFKGAPYAKNFELRKTNEERQEDRSTAIEIAFEGCQVDGKTTVKALMEATGYTKNTVRSHLKEHGGFYIYEGKVGRL